MNEEAKKENIMETQEPAAEPIDLERLQAEERKKSERGTLELVQPILAMGKEVHALKYDFTKVTNAEYLAAMDSDTGSTNLFRFTAKQLFYFFSCAAAKENDGLDAKDIRQRLSALDADAAVKQTLLFFTLSAVERAKATSKRTLNA